MIDPQTRLQHWLSCWLIGYVPATSLPALSYCHDDSVHDVHCCYYYLHKMCVYVFVCASLPGEARYPHLHSSEYGQSIEQKAFTGVNGFSSSIHIRFSKYLGLLFHFTFEVWCKGDTDRVHGGEGDTDKKRIHGGICECSLKQLWTFWVLTRSVSELYSSASEKITKSYDFVSVEFPFSLLEMHVLGASVWMVRWQN